MKKLKCVLCFCFLITSFFPVYADEKGTSSPSNISFSEEYPIEESLNDFTKKIPHVGDSFITRDTIQKGIDYAEMMHNSTRDIDEEIWTCISITTVRPYGVIKGKYSKKVSAGISESSHSFTVSVSGNIFGYPLSLTSSVTGNITYNGPTGTETVKPGVYATHRYFSATQSGNIVRYIYEITSSLTGKVLRTETVYLITNATFNYYANLGSLDANTGTLTVRSCYSSNYKVLSESSWIAKVNSTSAWQYIHF